MKYGTQRNKEREFLQTGKGIHDTYFKIDDHKIGDMNYHSIVPYNTPDYYFKEKFQKRLITLHFTEGLMVSDMYYLTKGHVSVPFYIPRIGGIYNLFPSSLWSYHLGRGTIGGNQFMSRHSIGIELANMGRLFLDGNILKDRYGSWYCDVQDVVAYYELDEPFRGARFYATFTTEQIKSLNHLLAYLTNRYDIPFELLPEDKRYKRFETRKEARAFTGICSHANFRKADELDDNGLVKKVDIGLAFPWDELKS